MTSQLGQPPPRPLPLSLALTWIVAWTPSEVGFLIGTRQCCQSTPSREGAPLVSAPCRIRSDSARLVTADSKTRSMYVESARVEVPSAEGVGVVS